MQVFDLRVEPKNTDSFRWKQGYCRAVSRVISCDGIYYHILDLQANVGPFAAWFTASYKSKKLILFPSLPTCKSLVLGFKHTFRQLGKLCNLQASTFIRCPQDVLEDGGKQVVTAHGTCEGYIQKLPLKETKKWRCLY